MTQQFLAKINYTYTHTHTHKLNIMNTATYIPPGVVEYMVPPGVILYELGSSVASLTTTVLDGMSRLLLDCLSNPGCFGSAITLLGIKSFSSRYLVNHSLLGKIWKAQSAN